MRNTTHSKLLFAALLTATLVSGCSWFHSRSDGKSQDASVIDSPGADVTFSNDQRKAKAAEAAKAASAGGGAQAASTASPEVVTVTGTGGANSPTGTEVKQATNGAAGDKAMDKGMDKGAAGSGADKVAMADKGKAGGDASMKAGDAGAGGGGEKVTLQGDAVFAFGKSDEAGMLPGGRQKLDELADRILAMDKAAVGGVTVVGHADKLGSAAGNMAISEKRAATVMNYLIKRGVDGGMLKSIGKGDTEPVVQCPGTAKNKVLVACLAANRRVEVLIGK